MKQLFIMLLLLTQYSCSGQQEKKSSNKKKIDKMKTFDANAYKDWEIDTYYLQSENDKFLKKGNDRVRILNYDKTIQIEKNDIRSPYKYYYLYDSKSKLLKSYGKNFILQEIGKWSYYDENGKLFKEIDTDKPYKFSISDLVEKFKIEYDLPLEDSKTVFSFNRYIEKEFLNIPIYEIGIYRSDISNTIEYYLVDGNNGKTLYSIKIAEGEIKSPLNEYLKVVKKTEAEDNAYFTTYKGKDYTKKEWKELEEQWYKNYQENKNKSFWDDIFSRRKK